MKLTELRGWFRKPKVAVAKSPTNGNTIVQVSRHVSTALICAKLHSVLDSLGYPARSVLQYDDDIALEMPDVPREDDVLVQFLEFYPREDTIQFEIPPYFAERQANNMAPSVYVRSPGNTIRPDQRIHRAALEFGGWPAGTELELDKTGLFLRRMNFMPVAVRFGANKDGDWYCWFPPFNLALQRRSKSG